ncbi:MAG TPA: hypothetical protein VI752_01470 [Candidatus Paceibacterota bacterium]
MRRISRPLGDEDESASIESVGGADSSTTKFTPIPRLIPRRGNPREQFTAGIGRG